MHGIFISDPHDGMIYVAERSRRGSKKLLWSSMPQAPIAAAARRVDPAHVPYHIRRAAYRWLSKPVTL